jgi:hypothetical protein
MAGAVDLQNYISSSYPSTALTEGDTIGKQLAGGAMISQNFEPLRNVLERAIDETLPEFIEQEASPEEIEEVVNTLFEYNGLGWLEEIVKNLAARVTEMRMQMVLALVDQQVTQRQQILSQEPDGTENESLSQT